MDTTERIPASARLAGFLSLLAAIAFGTSTAWAQNSAPDGIPAPDWSGLVAARQVARHAIGTSEHGHEAFNPGQRWSTRFDGRGFEVEPEVAAWRWGLELASFGTGREQRSITRTADVSVAGPRLTYGWTPALEEWYVNDGRGLEHGYTVRQRFGDVRDGDRLVFVLRVRGGLTPEVSADGRDVHFLNEGGRATVHYCGLTVFDADGRTLEAGFELDGDCLRLTVDDSDASYPVTIDPVAQQAYLKASNSDDGDHFGYAVAIDGNYAVVGAPLEDSDATGVNGDQSNRRAVDSGAAYVFRRNSSGTWVQEAYLKPTDTDAGDDFGWSVAISGLTVVVGAPQEDSVARTVDGNDRDNSRSDSGAAYVYVREPRFATWTVQGYLKASNADADDGFGGSVAIDGDTIVVGANLEDSHATGVNGAQGVNGAPQSGAAYVYVRSGPQWSQQ
ncbi:MAG: FG-GAP repeat protein, partial [Planctomycetes bacterium]|nr:FG-GAP repeat protein [Planctomycetota bacterium]